MYTLWWMNCKIRGVRNEHQKCSFHMEWCDVGCVCSGLFFVWSYSCSSWFSHDVCNICVTSTMILWAWFLYIEEFSILPCPTCPAWQTYISVRIIHDTLADTLPCFVSKISVCICYDGWNAKYGMCETNMNNVRFHPYSDWCNMHCVVGSSVGWMRGAHSLIAFAPYVRCVFCIRVTCIVILWTWFPYKEEFSKLPCPACPTCQSYISVGFVADTFVSVLPCQVSKIGICIRYDGWSAYSGIWQTNMDYVRFYRAVIQTYVRALAYCLLLYIHMVFWLSVLIVFPTLMSVLSVSSVLSVCMCYDGC